MISEGFYFLYWNSKRLWILKLVKWLRPCSSGTKGLNRLFVGQAAVGWTATYSSSTPAHLFTQVCNLSSCFFSLFSSFFLSFLPCSSLPHYSFISCSSSWQQTNGGLPLSSWSWIHEESVHLRYVNFY